MADDRPRFTGRHAVVAAWACFGLACAAPAAGEPRSAVLGGFDYVAGAAIALYVAAAVLGVLAAVRTTAPGPRAAGVVACVLGVGLAGLLSFGAALHAAFASSTPIATQETSRGEVIVVHDLVGGCSARVCRCAALCRCTMVQATGCDSTGVTDADVHIADDGTVQVLDQTVAP